MCIYSRWSLKGYYGENALSEPIFWLNFVLNRNSQLKTLVIVRFGSNKNLRWVTILSIPKGINFSHLSLLENTKEFNLVLPPSNFCWIQF